MGNARPFWTSTLQDLSIEINNAPRQGDLILQIVFRVFGSLGGLHFPTFGSGVAFSHFAQSGVATGEGGGFPRVRAVVSHVSPELAVAYPSTKGAPESGLTN